MSRLNTKLPKEFFARYTAQGRNTSKLSAEDKLEIAEVVYGLEWVYDSRQFDVLNDLITDDIIFDHPYTRRQGKQQFIDFWKQNEAAFLDGLRHQVFDLVITGNADGTATAVNYIVVIKFADTSDEVAVSLPTVIAHGLQVTQLRKEEDIWKVAKLKIDQFSISPVFLPDAEIRHLFAAPSEEREMTLEEAQLNAAQEQKAKLA